MKHNRIIWGLTALLVLITIAVSLGSLTGYSQKETTKEQDKNASEDVNNYAITDYNAPESENAIEREERKLKNRRYDNQDWVLKNPHPNDSGVGRYDETIPPPLIPDFDSNLVVVGEIVKVTAHLSNDKSGIYSEFSIRVKQILKNDLTKKIEEGGSVTTDRAGGYVRYPNGQMVLYLPSTRALPHVGAEYLFFLKYDQISPNYEILTGYELKETNVIPLDTGRKFDDFKNLSKLNFLEIVRNSISESSITPKSRRKP